VPVAEMNGSVDDMSLLSANCAGSSVVDPGAYNGTFTTKRLVIY
jgi:hypothetical protein